MNSQSKKYFSLVELLVVVTVMFVLASLLAPTMNRVFYSAQNTECKVNLKSIHGAISIYIDDNDNFLPGPSENSARPYYYRRVQYNSRGELFRRNQKLARYLAPYMTVKRYDADHDYNEAFICPSNAEMTELGDDPITRPHYSVINPRGVDRPFGIWKRRRDGVTLDSQASKRFDTIGNPADIAALKDVLDKNQQWGPIPDFPVHPEFLENHLYFDGRIESIQNITF